ncbi:bisanhydrobacterioruberin hydratase CruF [Methanothermobacter thermautotrophicus]|nr:bisanhydrobacterioruberin hydratase CruF [Methanothermobacter thermautotrophicus]
MSDRAGRTSIVILLTGILLAVSSYFVSGVRIEGYWILSVIFIISMAVPSFISTMGSLKSRGFLLILLLGIYAISIETLAIITGFPYSEFHYGDMIGLKILGYTPFTVPFAWLPLFLGSAYLAKESVEGRAKFMVLATLIAVLTDVVIDPAAVNLRFWVWENPGIFYGVPLQNFAGWILSGLGAAMISLLVAGDSLQEMGNGTVSSLYLIMCFWTGVCLFRGLEMPFIVGLTLIALILRTSKFKLW